MQRLLINDGILVTVNARGAIFRGSLLVEDGRISRIARHPDTIPTSSADHVLSATGCIVLPGLVNAHLHPRGTWFRGLGDGLTLAQQRRNLFLRSLVHTSREDAYYVTLLTLLECLKSGTTFACIDTFAPAYKPVDALRAVGMRGAVVEDVVGRYREDWSYEPYDEATSHQLAQEHARRCRRFGIVPILHGPSEEYFDKRVLVRTKELAARLKLRIQMHLAETQARVRYVRRRFGMRPVHYLAHLGFLSARVMAVHAVWVDPTELSMIRGRAVCIVATPVAEMKLRDGVAPVPRYLAQGTTLCLGTDGGLWNNGNDVFREMKTLCLLHSLRTSPQAVSPEDALASVTIQGARAFGMESQFGSLEVGKRADIVILNANQPHLRPLFLGQRSNIASNVVFCATGGDVDSVIIDGHIVMRQREVLTVKEDQVLERAQAAAEKAIRLAAA